MDLEKRSSAIASMPPPASGVVAGVPLTNLRVAEQLDEAARLLQAQDASPHRVRAYRHAAESVARHPYDVRVLFESEGVKGLDAIHGVGLGIASAIGEILVTGRWAMLERLRGETDPVTLFRLIPGVGEALAQRIATVLHEDSLEGLEAAACDGRLEAVPGVGARRAAAIRACLERLLHPLRRPSVPLDPDAPTVATLLSIDAEYRRKATARELRTIAPRRFNPTGEPWLPVLHARRDGWHFTALYSNTALAHRMRRVFDWVVIYWYDGDHVERQCTVVTEYRGPSAGRRVVRGREDECRRHHEAETSWVGVEIK